MSSSRISVLAIALAAAGVLLLTPAAPADVPRVKVGGQVTLTFTAPDHFEGRVTSRKPVCERFRRADLWYWMMPSSPRETLDFDRTDADGDYEIDIEPFAIEGDYQTSVRRKVVRRPNRTIICKHILSVKHHF